MNELSNDKQAAILQDGMERMGMRGLARTKRGNKGPTGKGLVSRTTVHLLWAVAGDTAIAFLKARLRNIPSRFIEADEAHTYVKVRGTTLLKLKVRAKKGTGVFWLWIAIDPETKLVVAWRIGKRGWYDAKLFMADLKSRLAGRIQLTTDSHTPYFKAVDDAWGGEIDYVTVKKWPKRKGKKKSAADYTPSPAEPPKIRAGNPDLARATTNHIEAWFGNLRKNLARFTRRGKLSSKTLKNLERAVALYIFHYNFIAPHHTLNIRPTFERAPGLKRTLAVKRTPAMAAGIEDTVWTWDHFIDLVEAAREERRKSTEPKTPSKVEDDESPPEPGEPEGVAKGSFVLFYSAYHRYAKLHLATCPHLRDTPEREGKKSKGYKLRCESIEEAENLLYDLAAAHADEEGDGEEEDGSRPIDADIEIEQCKVCLGKYNLRRRPSSK